ncbi:hypothetical protein EK904_000627 [Melospiza melodia maxima]|nr:hypothetical protein EK904_000627 [Melospiza melodia maxima]
MEPTWRMQEEEKKFRGKCQANAFCWSAGSCVARELFLAELAQRLCLPPLANFHKLLWNTGGSLELSDRALQQYCIKVVLVIVRATVFRLA